MWLTPSLNRISPSKSLNSITPPSKPTKSISPSKSLDGISQTKSHRSLLESLSSPFNFRFSDDDISDFRDVGSSDSEQGSREPSPRWSARSPRDLPAIHVKDIREKFRYVHVDILGMFYRNIRENKPFFKSSLWSQNWSFAELYARNLKFRGYECTRKDYETSVEVYERKKIYY